MRELANTAWQIIYNPDISEREFLLATQIIASPDNIWPQPEQKYIQCFLQQDEYTRDWLGIKGHEDWYNYGLNVDVHAFLVPVLEAPNPWHMPDDIRAQEDVLARFDAYTLRMSTLKPEMTMPNPYSEVRFA